MLFRAVKDVFFFRLGNGDLLIQGSSRYNLKEPGGWKKKGRK